MKAALLDLLGDARDGVQARSTAREYLQARILLALQDHGAFTEWAFLGGTALRFLYQLPRYSEDLDFSLVTPGGDGRFEPLMRSVRHDLTAEAYAVEVTIRNRPRTSSCSTTRYAKQSGTVRRRRRQRGVNSSPRDSNLSIGKPRSRT